jgi:exopolysaccharide production protein ExoZ
MANPPQSLLSIQYLRGIAALLVVLHHTVNPEPWLFNPLSGFEFGKPGVDIFFVISGFIIMMVGQRESLGKFVRRRLARIVPLYWIFTVAYVALQTAIVPHVIAGWDWTHLLRSLLFIPYESPIHPGENWPLLLQGWTLNFEMLFYAIFALGILTRKILPTLFAFMVPLVVAGLIFRGVDNPLFETYTSPLLLEFLAGAVLGYCFARKMSFSRLWPLLPLGFAALVWIMRPEFPEQLFDVMCFFAALSVVSGALALEPWFTRHPLQLLKLLGDSSYAIYLTHTLTLQLTLAIWKRLPIEGWPQFVGLLAVSMVACSAMGVIVYRLLDRPIYERLKNPRPPLASTQAVG